MRTCLRQAGFLIRLILSFILRTHYKPACRIYLPLVEASAKNTKVGIKKKIPTTASSI